jgi:predicted nucleic acid-binding protein
MTRYLLDTDMLIDFSKGREPTRTRVLQMIDSGDVMGVCAVNIAEFYAGLPEQERPQWDDFFASVDYWHINRHAAIQAGQYRHAAARNGQTLTTTDSLIAAVALEYDATILTSNISDYPGKGLTVMSPGQDLNL